MDAPHVLKFRGLPWLSMDSTDSCEGGSKNADMSMVHVEGTWGNPSLLHRSAIVRHLLSAVKGEV